MANFPHRLPFLSLLKGDGMEIGALNEASVVGAGARVCYVDARSREESAKLFPELAPAGLVAPDRIADLDAGGLSQFGSASMDFVIASHVLEHLANPISAVGQIFSVLRAGGIALIAIPDKRYTFDRHRATTSFEHLWRDYLEGTRLSSDEHYLDFLKGVAPHVFDEPAENMFYHLNHARARREHCHVWDSETFQEFMFLSLPLLGYRAKLLAQSPGEENSHEYFGLWMKL